MKHFYIGSLIVQIIVTTNYRDGLIKLTIFGGGVGGVPKNRNSILRRVQIIVTLSYFLTGSLERGIFWWNITNILFLIFETAYIGSLNPRGGPSATFTVKWQDSTGGKELFFGNGTETKNYGIKNLQVHFFGAWVNRVNLIGVNSLTRYFKKWFVPLVFQTSRLLCWNFGSPVHLDLSKEETWT